MILAGPILRHVDAKSVNIWIAMDENPTIKITLKKGTTDLVGESKDAATTYVIGNPPASGSPATVKPLVIKLISFTPNEDLVANEIYSYDLKNGNTSILTPLMDTDDLPLGYEKNKLPSFVLPAKDLKDLVVAHGSCRRIHGEAPEALCLLDDVLKDNTTRNTPNKRIQQVFLTGDQIYADEVPRFGLWSMTQCANKFISDKEDLPTSIIPPSPPPNQQPLRLFPADAVPGLRQALLNDDAKMSTGSGEAHLLTFGEFCAGYLHAWSTDVWHQDLINVANLVKTEGISQDTINAQGVVTARGTISKIWDGFDSPDVKKKIVGFKKNAGFTVENLRNRPYLFTAKNREDMATYPTFDKFFEAFEKNRKAGVALEVLEVANFMDSVKKVRRVLANTPTYMIFDDHEISDDWNISMKWKNEVYGNTLGKAIVRNGLMAYALFQDLGNTPSEYAKADSKKTALTTEIVNYAKTANFSTFSTVAIDKILGITDGSAKLEINWHYLVNSGPKVKTLFLDTRNRRSFKDLNARPALLSKEAFEEQFKLLPASPAADDVLFLIAACPALDMSVFEELVYPMYSSGESAKKGLLEGQIVRDNESWHLNNEAYEELLKRMSPFKRVVMFSGDIHFGFTTYLDYWKKGTLLPSRYIQLVSSPLKNVWKKNIRLFHSGFVQSIFEGFGGKLERFGWAAAPSVSGNEISLVNRRRLREIPAVIDNFGWKKGVAVTPEPDWRYRLQVPFDDHEDPDFPIKDDFDHTKNEDIKRITERFQRDFKDAYSRRFVFATHVCKVSFDADNLKHTFLYRNADSTKTLETTHTIALVPTLDVDKKLPELPKVTPQ